MLPGAVGSVSGHGFSRSSWVQLHVSPAVLSGPGLQDQQGATVGGNCHWPVSIG